MLIIRDEHVSERLSETPTMTLGDMVDALKLRFNVSVSRQTVRRHIDGSGFSIKQLHNQPSAMNSDINNGWSKRGVGSTQVRTSSKGANVHIIASISRNGLVYFETRFGSFTKVACQEFVRSMLRSVPVFEDEEFADACFLRLAPYSPMLNLIENAFSALEAEVTRYLGARRTRILNTPPSTTIAVHRISILHQAAIPQVMTQIRCVRAYSHAVAFRYDAIVMRDMPVGT
ncbi:TPA: hypothetical protein N0F65_006221 [Lagenidium giganteum]|uniref:Tc1-like transposase DDE domain-containing protein n=1 Tax=Lagenidium giganteum TaxID=4803 RepID=A0AAV2Z580_9STRA|nr:TPA: hypothetical protein N0F65_006221 [Lagenidium giganteum]